MLCIAWLAMSTHNVIWSNILGNKIHIIQNLQQLSVASV